MEGMLQNPPTLPPEIALPNLSRNDGAGTSNLPTTGVDDNFLRSAEAISSNDCKNLDTGLAKAGDLPLTAGIDGDEKLLTQTCCEKSGAVSVGGRDFQAMDDDDDNVVQSTVHHVGLGADGGTGVGEFMRVEGDDDDAHSTNSSLQADYVGVGTTAAELSEGTGVGDTSKMNGSKMVTLNGSAAASDGECARNGVSNTGALERMITLSDSCHAGASEVSDQLPTLPGVVCVAGGAARGEAESVSKDINAESVSEDINAGGCARSGVFTTGMQDVQRTNGGDTSRSGQLPQEEVCDAKHIWGAEAGVIREDFTSQTLDQTPKDCAGGKVVSVRKDDEDLVINQDREHIHGYSFHKNGLVEEPSMRESSGEELTSGQAIENLGGMGCMPGMLQDDDAEKGDGKSLAGLVVSEGMYLRLSPQVVGVVENEDFAMSRVVGGEKDGLQLSSSIVGKNDFKLSMELQGVIQQKELSPNQRALEDGSTPKTITKRSERDSPTIHDRCELSEPSSILNSQLQRNEDDDLVSVSSIGGPAQHEGAHFTELEPKMEGGADNVSTFQHSCRQIPARARQLMLGGEQSFLSCDETMSRGEEVDRNDEPCHSTVTQIQERGAQSDANVLSEAAPRRRQMTESSTPLQHISQSRGKRVRDSCGVSEVDATVTMQHTFPDRRKRNRVTVEPKQFTTVLRRGRSKVASPPQFNAVEASLETQGFASDSRGSTPSPLPQVSPCSSAMTSLSVSDDESKQIVATGISVCAR